LRKRSSFARIGALSVALLMALGAMGTAYGEWSDTLNISGTIETGEVSFTLTATESGNYTIPSGGYVTCEVVDDSLEVTVIDPDSTYDYYGAFTIENTGDIPLKMRVDTVLTGVLTTIIIDSPGDGIIDPTETESGKVKVDLTDGPTTTFIIITNVVPWNQ
jgi:hypothetical protein